MAASKPSGLSRPAAEPWARHVLDAAADADAQALRRAALGKLAASGWKADSRTQIAVETVASPTVGAVETGPRGAAEGYVEVERFYRSHVEKLAGDFFTLPPAERRATWDRLWSQTADYPAVRHRLKSLQPGLAVELPSAASPTLQQLIDLAAKWFTTRIGERGELRRRVNELMPEDEGQRTELVEAFRICGASKLAAGMLDDLPTPARRFAAPPKKMPWREHKRVHRPAAATVTKKSSEWSGVWWVAPMIVLLNVFRSCDSTPTRPHRAQPHVNEDVMRQLQQLLSNSQSNTSFTFTPPSSTSGTSTSTNRNEPGSALRRLMNSPPPRPESGRTTSSPRTVIPLPAGAPQPGAQQNRAPPSSPNSHAPNAPSPFR